MKIGDRIFVRGYIDEIRKDTVIVRNDGWYFGTILSEIITGELPSAQPEQLERCPIYDGVCGYPSDQCYECPRHYGAKVASGMEMPSAQPDNKLSKIAELVEGTIDHFDLDDAMDLLYQIKEVLKK